MPTVQQLGKELTKLKLKEVPSHVQKFAGQHWTPPQLQGRLMNWLQDYKVKVRLLSASEARGCCLQRAVLAAELAAECTVCSFAMLLEAFQQGQGARDGQRDSCWDVGDERLQQRGQPRCTQFVRVQPSFRFAAC
jgi:hypothetical protein